MVDDLFLDLTCPKCHLRHMTGWCDTTDDGIIMCCKACDIVYLIDEQTNEKTILEEKI